MEQRSILTPGFNGLGKYNCKARRETFKFWDLVHYILESYGISIAYQIVTSTTAAECKVHIVVSVLCDVYLFSFDAYILFFFLLFGVSYSRIFYFQISMGQLASRWPG